MPPKQRYTANRIFERIQEEEGFTGGESRLRGWVRGNCQWPFKGGEFYFPLFGHLCGFFVTVYVDFIML